MSMWQVSHLKELQGICRDYIVALNIELVRKKTTDPKRAVELAAYFTHCNLQPAHLLLSLRSAMISAFKIQVRKKGCTDVDTGVNAYTRVTPTRPTPTPTPPHPTHTRPELHIGRVVRAPAARAARRLV